MKNCKKKRREVDIDGIRGNENGGEVASSEDCEVCEKNVLYLLCANFINPFTNSLVFRYFLYNNSQKAQKEVLPNN